MSFIYAHIRFFFQTFKLDEVCHALFSIPCSQEISDGVSKSTQAVQAAEAGILQIGTIARQQSSACLLNKAFH